MRDLKQEKTNRHNTKEEFLAEILQYINKIFRKNPDDVHFGCKYYQLIPLQ